jgi:hypothetical protein
MRLAKPCSTAAAYIVLHLAKPCSRWATTATYIIVHLAKPCSTAVTYTVVHLAKSCPGISSSAAKSCQSIGHTTLFLQT